MASRPPNLFNNNSQRPPLRPIHTSFVPSFLSKFLKPHVPNSTQLMGFLTLVISGGILLLLSGLTLTSITLGMIFFTPLLILSSPIWIPIGTFLFLSLAGFLSVGGFGAAITWVYRYLRRSSSRMEDDSSSDSNGKDNAREFGGYLKDTAPGA